MKAHLTGAVSQLQRRQLAQMGRCITQCSPSAMLSVQMPFCGEVIDFFTCPVTLDGQTKTADSFASREYFTQLRSLPPKEVSLWPRVLCCAAQHSTKTQLWLAHMSCCVPRCIGHGQECKVSFKAFTCYRFFPRCTAGQYVVFAFLPAPMVAAWILWCRLRHCLCTQRIHQVLPHVPQHV